MELQDYLNALAIYVPTSQTLAPGTVIDAVNKARRAIAAMTDVTITMTSPTGVPGGTVTANQAAYPFPTVGANNNLILSVFTVWCYNGNLRWELKRVVAGDYPFANFNGIPDRFYICNRTMTYWPTPSTNWQSDWKVKLQPVNLVTPTQVDYDITDEYTDATVFLAAEFYSLADTNAGMAQLNEKTYAGLLDRLPRNTL